jgi:ABC-type amino acid transport substrate-binding protein
MKKQALTRRLLWSAWLGLAIATAWTTVGSAQTLQLITERREVRIGFIPDQAPFASASAGGIPVGYALDLCTVVARELERRVEKLSTVYVEVGSGDSLKAVGDGRVDLLCGAVSATLQRRETVDFSEPIFVTGASAVVRSSAPRVLRELVHGDREISPPRSLEMAPFSVMRVGVRGGTTTEAQLQRAIAAGGYNATVTDFPTHAEGWAALKAGTIDAYFADRALLGSLLATAHNPGNLMLGNRLLTREIYAIAIRHGDADLRLLVDRALTKFYQSPDFTALLQRYFGVDSAEVRAQVVALATPD